MIVFCWIWYFGLDWLDENYINRQILAPGPEGAEIL